MNRLKKRTTAALVLVLSALLSVFGIGGWKLHQARAEAEKVFFEGSGGFSVYQDLLELREVGYNLLRITESTGGADAEQRAAASAWARLDEAKTPEEYAAAYSELSASVAALDRALTEEKTDLPDSWTRQLGNFYNFASHLRFDSYYDEKTTEYNRLLQDPLAALVGRLTGCGQMPRFTEDR